MSIYLVLNDKIFYELQCDCEYKYSNQPRRAHYSLWAQVHLVVLKHGYNWKSDGQGDHVQFISTRFLLRWWTSSFSREGTIFNTSLQYPSSPAQLSKWTRAWNEMWGEQTCGNNRHQEPSTHRYINIHKDMCPSYTRARRILRLSRSKSTSPASQAGSGLLLLESLCFWTSYPDPCPLWPQLFAEDLFSYMETLVIVASFPGLDHRQDALAEACQRAQRKILPPPVYCPGTNAAREWIIVRVSCITGKIKMRERRKKWIRFWAPVYWLAVSSQQVLLNEEAPSWYRKSVCEGQGVTFQGLECQNITEKGSENKMVLNLKIEQKPNLHKEVFRTKSSVINT